MSRTRLIAIANLSATVLGLLLSAVAFDAIASFFGLGLGAPVIGAIAGGALGFWYFRQTRQVPGRRWLALLPPLPWLLPFAGIVALNRHGSFSDAMLIWLVIVPSVMTLAASAGTVLLARGFRLAMSVVGAVHSLAAPLVMLLLVLATSGVSL